MSDFLSNLARRGAGLPLNSVQAPTRSHAVPKASVTETRAPAVKAGEVVTEAQTQAQPALRREPPLEAPVESEKITQTVRESFTPEPSPLVTTPAPPETEPVAPKQIPVRVSVQSDDIESDSPSILPLPTAPAAFHEAPSMPTKSLPGASGKSESAQSESLQRPRISSGAERAMGEIPAPPMNPWTQLTSPHAHAHFAAASEAKETRDREVVAPKVIADEAAPAMSDIRPAAAESFDSARRFRAVVSPSSSRPNPTPIHVRIGRVEVRATPRQAPPQPTPSPIAAAPLGFASYSRIRNYRNWAL